MQEQVTFDEAIGKRAFRIGRNTALDEFLEAVMPHRTPVKDLYGNHYDAIEARVIEETIRRMKGK